MPSLTVNLIRFILLIILSTCHISFATVPSIDNQSLIIPLASNFQVDARQQLQNKRVIMLYVSAPHCAYCKKLEKEIIFPLLKSREYDNKIMLRKIEWHGDREIVDFDGHILKSSQFLARYKVKVTPTLIFLGENGEEIHRPLLGYRGGEFYWYYFDAAIEKSNRWLND